MVYQYIFGRDTEIGYKTINASTKLKADGEYTWQGRLNIEYTPPDNVKDSFPEPLIYFNIKDQTAVVGKIIYQTSGKRNNYMQHYYLLEGDERDEFLKNNYQFDITNFESTVEGAYNVDIESQDIYNHVYFTLVDAKKIIANQKISKKVLELILFSCFEAISTDAKILFIEDFTEDDIIDKNLNLLKIIFSILPPIFKERLGFITYYKHLISPAGKALRSDIKLIFTENNDINLKNRSKAVREGNYIFDFVNSKTAVNTENIMYGSLLEFITEPFFINRTIEEVLNVLNRIISYFTEPHKIRYNLAAIVYEILYKKRKLDYRIANILVDNYDILGKQLKDLLLDWILSDEMFEIGDDMAMYSLLFKIYNYDEYKEKIVNYFAEQINNKSNECIEVLFEKETPNKLLEHVIVRVLNDDKFLEGGIFLLHTCIMNTKDKVANVFYPIEVFDVIKYFCQFSEQYYKYFDELEIYENYFKNSLKNLDITGFENLSSSFLKLIENVNNEATAARLKVLHRLILKKYLIPKFELLKDFPDTKTAIDTCYRMLACARTEDDYFHDEIRTAFRDFSLSLVNVRNFCSLENVDYYFDKAAKNYEVIDIFLDVLGEVLIKAFSKQELTTEEYNRLLFYSKDLDINLDTNKIENFELLEFNAKLMSYAFDNNVNGIIKLLESKGSFLKANTKNELIKWIKEYRSHKDSNFYKLLIYIYADNYNEIFSFIKNDENYTALKLYMKEMKNLGLSLNKDYIKYISNYINEDRKLKKYFRSLNNNQRKEIGLPNFAEINDSNNFSNPIIPFVLIYILLGITLFFIIRTVNSILNIDNIMITLFVNIVLIGAMYALWMYKLSEYDITEMITRIFTIVFGGLLVVNVAVGIITVAQPRNKVVSIFKDLYSIKYDKLSPDLNIGLILIDNNGSTNLVDDFKDGLTINENAAAIINLQVKDDSDFSVRANLNGVERAVENKNKITIAGDELNSESSELIIKAEDIYSNKSEIKLNVIKELATEQNTFNTVFSSLVYDSENNPTDYPNLADGFELNIQEGSRVEFNFNVEAQNKCTVYAKLNNIDIPLQSFSFAENGFKGSLNFNFDGLQDTNILNLRIGDNKEIKEFNFKINKTAD